MMDEPLSVQADSFDAAVRWIYGRINYERVRPARRSNHFRLDRISHLLSLIGSPQERLPVVHIAGTKGKGSTAAMLDSILRAAGMRIGLFTSPHVESFAERMKVNGRQPEPLQLVRLVDELREQLLRADRTLVPDGPTYFEVATLLAWMYFFQSDAELAVLETGLGGRLDCTNVCRPLITVITSIGLDHTHVLGDTIEQIAAEKAGILKAGVPLITGVVRPQALQVCEARAEATPCPVTRLHRDIRVECVELCDNGSLFSVMTPERRHERLHVPLYGAHQVDNAALAVAVADRLACRYPAITSEAIRHGLTMTEWPLRFEVITRRPTIVLDAGHNPDAAVAVVNTLENGQWPQRPRILVFAASADKDADGMLTSLIPAFDSVVLTRFENNPRSRSPEQLRQIAAGRFPSQQTFLALTPAEAIGKAESLAGNDGLVCATGSLFLAAELRTLLGRSSTSTGHQESGVGQVASLPPPDPIP